MGNKKRKTINLLFLSLVLLLSGALLGACSKADAEDSNVDVIKSVLKLQFNGPDETLMKLLQDPKYKTVVDGIEVNEEFDKYVAEVYGPYFTEFYLGTFLRMYGIHYPSSAHMSGHKLNLKKVVIEKSENASNRYTFTATVGYTKDGDNEKTANVSGVVLISTKEEGKIGKFEYGGDNGLLKELRVNE
ncbi:hypothetical protein M3152_08280 [Sporosarcina luteola]|uniref:hypothetical protein n=1 Tax=Sporosarcina luteola TaxID=582850 RepID=UPI00203DCC61|nr:hypothetical protein [Sporosarcina luteola]MCM3637717.1 hypothetical protein [Sporosarcina luteola]